MHHGVPPRQVGSCGSVQPLLTVLPGKESAARTGALVERLGEAGERAVMPLIEEIVKGRREIQLCAEKIQTCEEVIQHLRRQLFGSRSGIRSWVCPKCQAEYERDVNAARNIQWGGIRLLQADGQTVYNCVDDARLVNPQAIVNESGSLVLWYGELSLYLSNHK